MILKGIVAAINPAKESVDKKTGQIRIFRSFYVTPENDIWPVLVNYTDPKLEFEVGEECELDVKVNEFTFINGKQERFKPSYNLISADVEK